eukprot:m.13338 g.13338  ORF g.13338 m.13338 type:complete len:66 (-) comp9687_c0_seq1:83-280(-)
MHILPPLFSSNIFVLSKLPHWDNTSKLMSTNAKLSLFTAYLTNECSEEVVLEHHCQPILQCPTKN